MVKETMEALTREGSENRIEINKNKTKLMKNLNDETPITLEGTNLTEVEQFTCMGSTMTISGESMTYLKTAAMKELNKWRSKICCQI